MATGFSEPISPYYWQNDEQIQLASAFGEMRRRRSKRRRQMQSRGLALVEVDAAATKEGAASVGEQEAQSNVEATASTDGGRAALVVNTGIFSLMDSSLLPLSQFSIFSSD
ncbi:hypothetical protein PIB30_045924 [Stylosanthes scabra]|uniref:Uncharacterized protein n=1 Tax=Stylosanthes scabra TaxID=79078 RepID=A0ABU6YIN7_9FABA|nr:hypothetical protein [Stylosanthes scabra]